MSFKARGVVRCSLEGKDLQAFSSVMQATEAVGTKYPSNLYNAIRYGLVAYGSRWRYEGEELVGVPKVTPGVKRAVVAVCLATNEETAYESLSMASRELGIGVTAIASSIKTGGKAKGYRFRYEGENLKTPAKRKPHRRGVEAHKGEEVKLYASAYEAALDLGVIPSAIYWCLNPKRPNATCKGYRLRYKKDS